MNKICTTIEQSKKLMELGIDINTADMYYKYILPKSDKIHHIPEIGNPINSLKWYNTGYTFRGKREPITLNEYCIPAWSLSALLELIPSVISLSNHEGKYNIRYANEFIIDQKLHDSYIDACYEVVVWLKENKKI